LTGVEVEDCRWRGNGLSWETTNCTFTTAEKTRRTTRSMSSTFARPMERSPYGVRWPQLNLRMSCPLTCPISWCWNSNQILATYRPGIGYKYMWLILSIYQSIKI